jgi:hypothetical protein
MFSRHKNLCTTSGRARRSGWGQQQVLNRLQAYTHAQDISKSRRDRLRHTLADLYGRCSAGTHAEVTIHEARFIFLQTYIALGEILTL